MDREKVCMPQPGNAEFSLCGDAFDIAAVDDTAEPFRIGNPGELVNCEKCREMIAEIKRVKRWRIP